MVALGNLCSRTLVGVSVSLAAFAACGRTAVDQLSDASSGGSSFAGTGGASTAGASPTGGAFPVGGAPPTGGVAPTGGAPISPPGGAGGSGPLPGGGFGGVVGTDKSILACEPGRIPRFDLPPSALTHRAVLAAAPGDFNGDGRLDLAGANADGSLSLLFGNGDGSFASVVFQTTGLEDDPRFGSERGVVLSADFDRSGTWDLAVSDPASAAVSVLLGNGDGTFASVEYLTPGSVTALARGDIDGDGDEDLLLAVASADGASAAALHAMRALGDGRFVVEAALWQGDSVVALDVGDVNGDGALDVVVLGYTQIWTLLGDGTGALAVAHETAGWMGAPSVHLRDFDADGELDLAVPLPCGMAPMSETGVRLFSGDGTGAFTESATHISSGGCVGPLALADVNGDGRDDLVVTPSSVFLANGDGTFSSEVRGFGPRSELTLAAADWTGDGRVDVLTSSGSYVSVRPGRGDGRFGSGNVAETSGRPHALVLADFGADAAPDVVTAHHEHAQPSASTGVITVSFNEGDGRFAAPVSYPASETRGLVSADVNRDGWADLLALRPREIAVMLGSATGQFSMPTTYPAADIPRDFDVGDVNGDGNLDVVIADEAETRLQVLLGRGEGSFENPVTVELPWEGASAIELFDADADGTLDLVFTSLLPDKLSVWRGDGTGNFSETASYSTADRAVKLAHGDLNRDGLEDVIFSNDLGLSVMLGAAGGRLERRTDYSGVSGAVVVADLDQDGLLDLVTSPGASDMTGLAVLYGNGDGTFRCQARYALGFWSNALGVADLNRDGRSDVAVVTDSGVAVLWSRTR